MAKIYTITTVLAGLILFLNLAGITTLTGTIINWFITNNIETSPFFILVKGAIFITFVGTIVAGLYLRQSSESFLITPIASALFIYVATDLLYIANISTGESWMDSIIKLIMYPIFIGYSIAIVQWWRGNDIL